MPWDEETQEYYPGPRDPRPEATCVMCGREWDEDYDRGGYVNIGDSSVCNDKCKWEFIHENFQEYLRKNNILAKVKAIAANPTLDAVIALKREMVDASADENGESADTNFVDQVTSPLFDLEDELKRGLNEYIPETLKELEQGVQAVINSK